MNTAAVTAAAPRAVTAESTGLLQWKCHRWLALLAAPGFGSGFDRLIHPGWLMYSSYRMGHGNAAKPEALLGTALPIWP